MNNRNLMLTAVVVTVALGLFVMFGNGSMQQGAEVPAGSTSEMVSPTIIVDHELPADSPMVTIVDSEEGAVDYALDLTNYAYSPTLIEAAPGETVRVKLSVTQGFHDFVIDELDVQSKQMGEGSEQIIEIKIPQNPEKTEYEFYCSIGNHRSLGMVGTLRIIQQ